MMASLLQVGITRACCPAQDGRGDQLRTPPGSEVGRSGPGPNASLQAEMPPRAPTHRLIATGTAEVATAPQRNGVQPVGDAGFARPQGLVAHSPEDMLKAVIWRRRWQKAGPTWGSTAHS